jgi:electron transfer flavoprotein alpha subunit
VLEAVVIGEAPRDQFQSLAAFGASKILHMGRPDLTPYTAESHGAALANLIQSRNPSVLLVPSTSRGRDYSPRTAARLGLGLTGDCIDLNINDEGRLVMIKPAFGGSVVAPIQSRTRPEMATVRPGMLQKAEAASARTLEVERVDPGEIAPSRVRVLSASRRSDAEGVALDDAPVIVGVGRGIGGPQNMEMVRTFAGALSAPLGATRVVTDAGWLPRQHQIGLTGRAVAPRLYIAVGVSGAFEHMVGLRRAETILAINKNPKAGIFKNCNFGIVGDFAEVLPLLGPALAKAGAIREKTG